MIKRVFRSASDLHNLSLKRTEALDQGVNLDYKNIVVNKPWGYEYLLFENSSVAIWILCLKKNSMTSMHCHPNKKTSLIILSGEAISSTLDTEFLLDPMDGLVIDSGVFHSTKSSDDDFTFLMEIETPPNKNDLIRLKDQYGRENKAYEGKVFMSGNLEEYNYCQFNSLVPDGDYDEEKKMAGKCLRIYRGAVDYILKNQAVVSGKANLCLLEGSLIDNDAKVVLDVGEVVTSEFINKIKENIRTKDCHMLIIY